MDFTKREILVHGFRLGSSLAALLIGSCVFSGERGDVAKPQGIQEREAKGTRNLMSQGTRKQVEVASDLLRKKRFLTRKEFVSICGFGGDVGEVSVGSPYEGRVGINESWIIADGTRVKASGYGPCDGELSPEMIDQVISGKILDNFKIFKIWIFDSSGNLIACYGVSPK
jgi:hypothetical protein